MKKSKVDMQIIKAVPAFQISSVIRLREQRQLQPTKEAYGKQRDKLSNFPNTLFIS